MRLRVYFIAAILPFTAFLSPVSEAQIVPAMPAAIVMSETPLNAGDGSH